MLFLNVPFEEKELAKAIGCRWNPQAKKWYIDDRKKYEQCLRWIDGITIVCDHFFLVEGVRTCFRCHRETTVIGFAFDTFYELDDDFIEYWEGEIHIGNIYSRIPEQLSKQLKERYNYYYGHSLTTQDCSNSNHCQCCGVLQGNWFVYDEVDTPFFIDGPSAASKLILHRIQLPQDIAINAGIGYGSEDHCIKEYAKIVDSDLQWA